MHITGYAEMDAVSIGTVFYCLQLKNQRMNDSEYMVIFENNQIFLLF